MESFQIKDWQLSLHRKGGEVSVFQLSDESEGLAGKNYFGFVNAEGGWVIQQYDPGAGTYRWVGGTSNYTTYWSTRTVLTYDYYYALFGTLI